MNHEHDPIVALDPKVCSECHQFIKWDDGLTAWVALKGDELLDTLDHTLAQPLDAAPVVTE